MVHCISFSVLFNHPEVNSKLSIPNLLKKVNESEREFNERRVLTNRKMLLKSTMKYRRGGIELRTMDSEDESFHGTLISMSQTYSD